jgi:hypothetical protein
MPERLLEFSDGLLYLLMRGIAAIARISVGSHKPLPDYRKRFHRDPLLRRLTEAPAS